MMRLVLLPGMHGTGELFSGFMRALPEPTQIEALSYPSDVSLSYPQLLESVRSFVPATDPYFLLAESFSTPLAIQFAATNPPNLKGLMLCAGFATSPLTRPMSLLALALSPLLFHLPLPSPVIDRFLVGPSAPESLSIAVRQAVSSVRPQVLASRLRTVLAGDVRRELSRIAVPVLYIQATEDKLVPPRCLREIQAISPQTKVIQLNGPHLILQREPRQAAEAVAAFIRTIP
jgi:pimeloyl-ACP methyl ester carboxylesterase